MADDDDIPGPIVDAALELVNARDLAEIEHVLRSRQGRLFTDEADRVLESLIDQHRDSDDDLAFLRSRRSLLHRCREYGIAEGLDGPRRAPPDVDAAVHEFVNIRDTAELMRFVERRRALLLSPNAAQVLDAMTVEYRDDDAIVGFLRERRTLLEACRRHGIEHAFSNEVITMPADLNAALGAFVTASVDGLRAVVEGASEILLTDEAERVLAFIAAAAEDANQAAHIRTRLALLRGCRAHGIAAVLDPAPPSGTLGDALDRAPTRAPPAPEVVDELVGELRDLAGPRESVGEPDLQRLLERRPELADALAGAIADSRLLWTGRSDAQPLRALLEELEGGYAAGDWDHTVEVGSRALEKTSRDDDPELWGVIHSLIGTALSRTPHGDRAELLDRSIEHHELARAALAHDTGPARAMNEHHLAVAYVQRVRGRQADNIEMAIAILRDPIDGAGEDGSALQWEMSLADALGLRRLGNPADNLREAVDRLQRVIARAEERGDAHARDQAVLALGMAWLRTQAGDRADNVEQAIALLASAAPKLDPAADLISWVHVHRSLATAYMSRIRGDAEANWHAALDTLARISDACPRETHAELWAENQLAVAAFHDAHPGGASSERRLKAVRLTESTLDVYTLEDYPDRWAKVQANLGSLYAVLSAEGAGYGELAIAHLEQAFRVYTRELAPDRWATTHVALGRLKLGRAEVAPPEERWQMAQEAIQHLDRALDARTVAADPSGRLAVLTLLGTVHFRHRRWRDALRIYTEAMRVTDHLLASAHTEPGRLATTSASNAIYDPAAYCLQRENDPVASLACAEWGKGRMLAQALALRDLDLAGLQAPLLERLRGMRGRIRDLEAGVRSSEALPNLDAGSMLAAARRELAAALALGEAGAAIPSQPRLRSDEIYRTVPDPGAVVMPVITAEGSVAYLIVKDGQGGFELVHIALDWLDTRLIRGIVAGTGAERGWIPSYRRWRAGVATEDEWRASLRLTLARLWEALIGPIVETLRPRVPERAPVTIVPPGALSFLPWHAASEDGSGVGGLLDAYEVSYAPSVYALRASRRRAASMTAPAADLLAVVNPTEDLEFAEAEGKHLESMLGGASRTTTLSGARATIDEVKAASRRRSHIHFACHGIHDPLDAARSGLQLADGTLTLGGILARDFDLSQARLVTLSACETGLIDFRYSADEFIGLPTAFLQGGACALISTAWPVNDRATSLLMGHFYEGHLVDELAPAAALRRAQLWLRDVTRGELDPAGGPSASERPYSDPYYWAPFQLTGA